VAFVLAVDPQEPHYTDGKHNAKFEGQHDADEAQKNIASCKISSCSGWSLNRLPKVKSFLHGEAANYPNLSVEWKHGAEPTAFFLDADNNVVESTPLRSLDEEGIHKLLESKGIMKRVSQN